MKRQYVRKSAEEFDQALIEALASGVGPDMIILPQDRIARHRDKIYQIPYESLSERDFKDSFVEEGELFMGTGGVYAVPFSLDPLVMYWNRDIFTNNSLSLPPTYWDEFFSKTIPLSEIDNSRNIKQSSVALGEYDNINNAKEILSVLLLQTGNKIVTVENGRLVSVLSNNSEDGVAIAESVLRFYTEFSNPSKEVYSWNKSLPQAKQAFLSGDLAIYFGFASEAFEIQSKNPNLNFDIALLPQVRDGFKATFGKISGVAILKSSKYVGDAFLAIGILTSEESALDYSSVSFLPPPRRKLLSKKPKDAIGAIFYESAIISKGWIDPDREKSSGVFKKMVENVTSGRLKLSEAVDRASAELNSLIK